MFFKGVSFGFMARNGYYSSEAGQQEINKIIASGADSVALMATILQDTFASTRMYRDFELTPSDIELQDAIRQFHKAGIRVMLKPILEHHDSTHRCKVNFPVGQEQIAGVRTDYWGEWFRNYTFALLHYARIAEAENVEMFCVGCEMTGVEKQESYWPPLLAEIRKVYHGLLTYNTPAWWDYALEQNWMRSWYPQLDMLGISHYYGADADCTSAEKLAEYMQGLVKNLSTAAEKLGKPIFMAEVGCRSVEGAQVVPSDCWHNHGEYDGEIQAAYMQSMFLAFSPQPWWSGFFWWKWDEQQNRPQFHKKGGDTGFTIAGKPAEKVFRDWKPPR